VLLGPASSPDLAVAAVAVLPGLAAAALVMSFDDLVTLLLD
jgi:hypothetical protein